jgi:cellulose 1,4-beta-cellobiosidase
MLISSKVYLSPYYAAEVQAAAGNITDATQSAKAASVANIPTFTWFDVIAKTPMLGTYLADAEALQKASGQKYLVQIVVYDLPDRDCAAAASNGEFTIADNGLANYETYIDQLVAQIQRMSITPALILVDSNN